MRRQFTGLSMVPKRRTNFLVVGERSEGGEAVGATRGGPLGSENAGMSNESRVRNPAAVSPRVPGEG